jgi:hypothetical protein
VSQNWCRTSLDLPNTPLLKFASLADKSATKSDAIRKNIGYLQTRMLGIFASEAETNALYTQVYLTLEPAGGSAAWTGVCAALIRHPLWLSF